MTSSSKASPSTPSSMTDNWPTFGLSDNFCSIAASVSNRSSRTEIVTGLRPSVIGIHGNEVSFRDHPKFKDREPCGSIFADMVTWPGPAASFIVNLPKNWSDAISTDYRYFKQMGTPYPPPQNRCQHAMRGKFSIPYFNRGLDWAPSEWPEE